MWREAAVKMIESGSQGVIINISSVARAGNIGQTNYSASKAAVATMATTWAVSSQDTVFVRRRLHQV